MRIVCSILVMAVVTYLIRMLPMTIFRKKIQSRFLQDFLYYIPYAILSAMTIPAVFYATGDFPSAIAATVIAKLYLKYREMDMLQGVLNSLRPAVVAMIASAGISILITAFWGSSASIALAGTKWSLVVIFAICVVLLQKVKMNPIWVMVAAGVMKVAVSFLGG